MTESPHLLQVKELLSSPLIRERQAGIEEANSMLANGDQRDALRLLLEGIAKSDPITIVRTAAQQALDADAARHPSTPAPSPDHIFGARCAKGHVSYYDKHTYCRQDSASVWRTVTRDGRAVDEILLRCKTPGCNEEKYIEVDCQGYR